MSQLNNFRNSNVPRVSFGYLIWYIAGVSSRKTKVLVTMAVLVHRDISVVDFPAGI